MSTGEPLNGSSVPSRADGLKAKLLAALAASGATFAEHVIEIACDRGIEHEVLERAVNRTYDPVDKKILAIIGAIKAAMWEGEYYSRYSALTDEPQRLPAVVDEPNPQRLMQNVIQSVRRDVLEFLEDLPLISSALGQPYNSPQSGTKVWIAAEYVTRIGMGIATINQLQELIDSTPTSAK